MSYSRTTVRDAMIMPCTVRQIVNAAATFAAEGGMVINRKKPMNVRLVGRCTGVQPSPDRVLFVFEDGTGSSSAIFWTIGEPAATVKLISDGGYAMIVARPDCKNNESVLTVMAVRRVDDFNLITHHFIECCHVHAVYTMQDCTPSPAINDEHLGPGVHGSSASNQNHSDPTVKQDTRPVIKAYGSTSRMGHQIHAGKPTATPFEKKIQLPLLTPGNADVMLSPTETKNICPTMVAGHVKTERAPLMDFLGRADIRVMADDVHIQSIIAGTGLAERDARKEIGELMDVGDVYSTVDDNHFKLAEK